MTNLEYLIRNRDGVTSFGKDTKSNKFFATVGGENLYKGYIKNFCNWLQEEHDVLDPVEKKYLRDVCRPFRKRITGIGKEKCQTGKEYIRIVLSDDSITFPYFEKGQMYVGMELRKNYTLKELGLDE